MTFKKNKIAAADQRLRRDSSSAPKKSSGNRTAERRPGIGRRTGTALGILLASLIAVDQPAVAQADDAKKIYNLAFFGGWAYGETDTNTYLGGRDGGDAEEARLGLAATLTPIKKLRLSAQIEAGSEEFEDELEVELDYAFAAWSFNDNVTLRAGRSKHPFGVFAEFFDIGTVRPFFDLPQSIYGPAGIAGESYDGIGLSGTFDIAGGWDLQYDVYYGSLDFVASEPWNILEAEDNEDAEGEEEGLFEARERQETLGVKVELHPGNGRFLLGFSAYTSTAGAGSDDALDAANSDRQQDVVGVHFRYDWIRFDVHGELAHLEEEDELETDAYYLEASYHLAKKWWLVGRYDRSDSQILEADLELFDNLAEHRDLALGINYWMFSRWVAKLSVHSVRGNRFAFPDGELDEIEVEEVSRETTLLRVGIQFSF